MVDRRPPIRVLVSASVDVEREWLRHRDVLRELRALQEWDLPVAQVQALRKVEDKRHRVQVQVNYANHQHTVLERAKVRMARISRKELDRDDPYFGYREVSRKQVLALRERFARGQLSLTTYNRLVKDVRMYCRAMIAHEKKVRALQDKMPRLPRIHLRRTKK